MRIAIIKTSALGDIVQAFQALRKMAQFRKDLEVTWVIEKSSLEILEGEPEIHDLITVEMKGLRNEPPSLFSKLRAMKRKLGQKEYDCIIDLQGNIKSLLLLSMMRSPRKIGFGYRTAPEKLNCLGTHIRYNPPSGHSIREDYLFLLANGIGIDVPIWEKENPKSPKVHKILCCPFSAWPNKELAEEAVFNLVKTHQESGQEVQLLATTSREQAIAETWMPKMGAKIFPPSSIKEFKEGVRLFDQVISVDSFPLHMADMQGVETFSLFGPSLGHKYAPIGSSYHQGECPYNITFEKRCPYLRSCKTGACIKQIDFGKKGLGGKLSIKKPKPI